MSEDGVEMTSTVSTRWTWNNVEGVSTLSGAKRCLSVPASYGDEETQGWVNDIETFGGHLQVVDECPPREGRCGGGCCGKWLLESGVLRIADIILPSVQDRPITLRELDASDWGSYFTMPRVRRCAALALFGISIIVSVGFFTAWARVRRTETFSDYLSIASLVGVPWISSVGAALLVDAACTVHLKTLAVYAILNWVAVCLANASFILEHLDSMSVVAGAFLCSACLADRALMLVFMWMAQRRVDFLEAVEIEGQISHSHWQRRLTKAVRVVGVVWMALACAGMPACEGSDWKQHITCRVTYWVLWGITGVLLVLFFCWVAAVLVTLDEVRTLAKDAAVTTKDRQEMECQSAAKAATEQMVGIILGSATTLVRGSVVTFWTTGQNRDSLSWEFWVVVGACQLDSFGNCLMSLAMGGFFSQALSFAIARSNHQFQRRNRWQAARSKWTSHENEAWQDKVKELASRGFTLEALLGFFKGLGKEYMTNFNPDTHTTADVVRQAIVPLSADAGCALSDLMMDGVPTKPQKMVTHNWSNLFIDLVAAVCADAMEEEEYCRIANLLERDVHALEAWLYTMGKMENTYWICAFSVNQHQTICDKVPQGEVDSVTRQPYPVCLCRTPKVWNTTPPTTSSGESIGCEVNKFDDMMKFLSQGDQSFEQVVAIDRHFVIFSRAWCVAELAAASAMGMTSRLKFLSTESISHNEQHLRKVRIQDMKASRPEDKESILKAIPDPDKFNEDLQRLLFEELLPSWLQIDSSEQMHRLAQIARWQDVARHRRSIGVWDISGSGKEYIVSLPVTSLSGLADLPPTGSAGLQKLLALTDPPTDSGGSQMHFVATDMRAGTASARMLVATTDPPKGSASARSLLATTGPPTASCGSARYGRRATAVTAGTGPPTSSVRLLVLTDPTRSPSIRAELRAAI